MVTLDSLPEEILYKILVHCDLPTVNSVSLCTKRLHAASQDTLVWQNFCLRDRELMGFHPSDCVVPVDGYRSEYIYQRHVDRIVEENIRRIVDDPATRFERILAISRLGLRSRPMLLKIYDHPDYDLYNLRYRYFAAELLQAVRFREAALQIVTMFTDSRQLDMFKFYIAFDAFQPSSDVRECVGCESLYSEPLSVIKQYLRQIKVHYENAINSREHQRMKKGNPLEAACRQLGALLYNMNLILDIQEFQPGRMEFNFRDVLQYYRIEQHTPVFAMPSYALMRAAIYVYCARWIGIDASIVVLDFDIFVRIEDKTRSDPLHAHAAKREGCFFADLNRAGKLREVEDMLELIRIANSPKTDLSPSTTHELIENFSHACISKVFPQPNQFEAKSDCVLFLGAMLCSFLCTAVQRQQALNIPIPIEFENTGTRRDLTSYCHTQCSVENIVRRSQKLKNLTGAKLAAYRAATGTEYNEDKLMHRFSMVIPSVTFQVPVSSILLTDFVIPLSPTLVKGSDHVHNISSIIDILQLKDRKSANSQGAQPYPDSLVPEFCPGDLIFHERAGQYGVIINTSVNKSTVDSESFVQHTAYMQGAHHLTVRESSIRKPEYGLDFKRLKLIDPQFFGHDIGIYCTAFRILPDCTSSFALAEELTHDAGLESS